MSEGSWVDILRDYSLYATGASAALGLIIFLYRKAVKPMFVALQTYYQAIEKIDKIFDEITPNGGTSMKDKIDKIDDNLHLWQEIQLAMAADTKAALFRTDSEGNCVWVNRTYTKIVGRSFSEILGHGWQNVISQEDREKVVAEWYKSVEENREFSMDYNFETPDGEKTLVKGRGYKLVNSKGDLLGYWGNCTILD